MSKTIVKRDWFVNPDARKFQHAQSKVTFYFYKSQGFYFVQAFRPRARYITWTGCAKCPLERKHKVRSFLASPDAQPRQQAREAKAPKRQAQKPPESKMKIRPKSSSDYRGWNVAEIVCSQYTPVDKRKRGMIERAKRALFG